MVKLALKGAQDPKDPSLQMKVLLSKTLRLGNILYSDANFPPIKTLTPKSMPSDCSPETKLSLRPSSGII